MFSVYLDILREEGCPPVTVAIICVMAVEHLRVNVSVVTSRFTVWVLQLLVTGCCNLVFQLMSFYRCRTHSLIPPSEKSGA